MRIDRFSLIEGAKRAKGSAVIIDVFRAFTTAAYVMANGAKLIIPVGSLEDALKLKRVNPEWVLIGEREGRRVEGFDYGNSPWEVSEVDFTDRIVIQTTSAGTQGIVNATGADEIILGSFVTAGSIIEYLCRMRPGVVSLVAMGDAGVRPNAEDELCASYIESSILGRSNNFEKIKKRIRQAPSGAKFFDPAQPQYRKYDFQMALELNRFNFILKVEVGDGNRVVKRPP
jgi:2-phosphosulfolactate phosphatase